MKLTILGIPLAKQSARFKSVKMGNKTFIKSYQKQEVVDMERNAAFDVKSQLPLGFKPFDCPLVVNAIFVFSPPTSWSKKKKAALVAGEVIYKDTKPDLQDNLFKGIADAMAGIVYVNDSRICEVHSKKIYGEVPRIEIEITPLINP